jgi:serine/threonine-protein kinase
VLNGKWRIERVLAAGGSSVVCAAIHRTGRRVAIKILHAPLATDPEQRARFLRQARAANEIDHPNVAAVFDDDATDDGLVFLVMELVPGLALDEWLVRAGGRATPAHVLAIAWQLLDVLAAAHAAGVVHRDIKPANLMLTPDGLVKVLDFGIARLALPRITRMGAVMGTVGFLPPEQARGRWNEVDERSDLWAVGATMFSLLAGRPIHEAPSELETLFAAMSVEAPLVASVVNGLPADVASIVDRALAFDKQNRWPDARAMQRAVFDAFGAHYR